MSHADPPLEAFADEPSRTEQRARRRLAGWARSLPPFSAITLIADATRP